MQTKFLKDCVGGEFVKVFENGSVFVFGELVDYRYRKVYDPSRRMYWLTKANDSSCGMWLSPFTVVFVGFDF